MALTIGELKSILDLMPNDSDAVTIQANGNQYKVATILQGDDFELILSADLET